MPTPQLDLDEAFRQSQVFSLLFAGTVLLICTTLVSFVCMVGRLRARHSKKLPHDMRSLLTVLEEAEGRVNGGKTRDRTPPAGENGDGPPSVPLPAFLPARDLRFYHAILGIDPRSTTRAVVEDAFRSAAMCNHPDKNGGDRFADRRFAIIKEAYERLLEVYREG